VFGQPIHHEMVLFFPGRPVLAACRGDAIALVMADESDDPIDLIKSTNKT
jgi:hypothetical protein